MNRVKDIQYISKLKNNSFFFHDFAFFYVFFEIFKYLKIERRLKRGIGGFQHSNQFPAFF